VPSGHVRRFPKFRNTDATPGNERGAYGWLSNRRALITLDRPGTEAFAAMVDDKTGETKLSLGALKGQEDVKKLKNKCGVRSALKSRTRENPEEPRGKTQGRNVTLTEDA
jgi:hypothetical protein